MRYEVVGVSDDCRLISIVPDPDSGHIYGKILGNPGFHVIDHSEERVIERLAEKYEGYLQMLEARDAALTP